MDLTTGVSAIPEPPTARSGMVCNGLRSTTPTTCGGKPPPGAIRSARKANIETIVPFYERFGPDAVARLEGMFGLAVWDETRSPPGARTRSRGRRSRLFWTQLDGRAAICF